MAQAKLDELIGKFDDPARDAVHVAILPVTAAEDLEPGQQVEIRYQYPITVGAAKSLSSAIGIVSPFLTHSVQQGNRFWVLMRPGAVNDLRHAWSHPLVVDEHEEGDGDDGCSGCY